MAIQKFEEKTLKDIDVYGRNNSQGGGLIHTGDFAISNAIILFLTSDEDDYIYRPKEGAGVRRFVFKLLTSYNSKEIEKYIGNIIQKKFGLFVENIQVQVKADFENRIQEINIFWVSSSTKKTNDIVFHTSIPQNILPDQIVLKNNFNDKIRIDFIGDNLIAFITLKQMEIKSTELLQYDNKNGYWYWGSYIFTNLNDSSPEFLEIKSMIG